MSGWGTVGDLPREAFGSLDEIGLRLRTTHIAILSRLTDGVWHAVGDSA
jgi:hypothetical protein